MNRKHIIAIGSSIVAALAAGYWLGQRSPESAQVAPTAAGPTGGEAGAAGARRVLYYRNPMGLADTSPVPKKDSMGMDYIPVYEGEEPDGPQIKIGLNRLQKLGVRTETAGARPIAQTVRAVGTIAASERTLYTISPRFEGWITKLLVNTTGEYVRRGQPLLAVYSPELVSAQEEYRIALQTLQALRDASPESRSQMQSLVDAALQRLRNWEIADADLQSLMAGGTAKGALILRSPANGVVIERMAVAGMRFMPGETLYQIADLSSVWLLANVFEQDLERVRPGQAARLTLAAYPGREFDGKVTFVYPTVEPETRTARVRVELPNEAGLLKPDLYGTVEIDAGGVSAQVAIPESAVLDSGTRQAVLVELGGGVFEPREVRLGRRGDEYVEVLSGIADGERVVVNGNFLIDAESNLKAALGTFGGHAGHGASSVEQEPASPATASGAEPAVVTDEHAGH